MKIYFVDIKDNLINFYDRTESGALIFNKRLLMIVNIFKLTKSLSVRFKTSMASINEAKQIAAYKAVDEHVKSGQVVGVGSGSTAVLAAQRLAERFKQEKLNIRCVPTSFQARQLIIYHKLPLTDLEIDPIVDITIDGADEVDANLTCIKGGGACLLQEKIVASNSKKLVIIADHTKDSEKLGEKWKKGVPLEVVPMAYVAIKNKIEKTLGGTAELRIAKMKAGPIVTDDGNFILDWKDFDPECNWEKVNNQLLQIPGLIETGLFVNMAVMAYFGMSDGSVKVRIPEDSKKCQDQLY